MLQDRLLGRFNLGERRLDRTHEVLGGGQDVGLVGMGEQVHGAHHGTAGCLAFAALEELDRAGGTAGNRDGHTAFARGQAGGVLDGRGGVFERERAERHALAARHDRGQHDIGTRAEQDERHSGGRLLKRLEQRVSGVGAQLLGAVDDIDLSLGTDGASATSSSNSRVCAIR